MSGEDWVDVQLTAFGEQYLAANGGGPLRIHDGNREFAFASGKKLRVTRAFDWSKVLAPQHVNGSALFEIAPATTKEPAGRVIIPQKSPGPGIFQRDGASVKEEKK